MSRNGKIARLPGPIREQINHRLENGDNGREVIAWLNSLDEVKTALSPHFERPEITDGNLSEWRLGGYRDWEQQQTVLAEARRVVSDGRELGGTADQALADNLAVWLTGRFIAATRKLMECEDHAESWKLLREMCHDVVALRRGDHGAHWLRLEQERLKLAQQKQESTRERLKEEIQKENPASPAMNEEEMEAKSNEVVGIVPEQSYVSPGGRFTAKPETAAPPPPETEAPSEPVKVSQSNEEQEKPLTEEEAAARELERMTVLAEKGDGYGAYWLGARYRDGSGVPKDWVKARAWLEKAAARGVGGAKIDLHHLIMRGG